MDKKRILVVEDEESLLKLETILLTVKGYEVIGCISGTDALLRLEREHIDLVLLDIMLPDIDGFEVCRRIKHDSKTSHVPVVMLTAKKSQADQERGAACGADAYMTKPFKSAVIIETIENLINGAGARV